ncbi:tRNA (adenosine(37)-N6)-dimethylallyltransferase MiaA [Treponema brennaborense]|uniref:tRNA dimethylallyltransferase n=1 Tax=Treponema brennaborense (strain DSM 12168 / CIP 105900 / DD5/3) TaxID=906968 RepID=F4LKE9_TREBD|nr:tRNA (adenosine(37)-N6)-dimethylallyltransferase MiaA [Treponema brennaborense]AEE16523.1 tRNA dimethylallyltransferase [Treponema brennaborense DSM 12168]
MYTCVIVLGPTACGKTALAVRLADALNGEILSADSRQVYRALDIGSGKDLDEFNLTGEDGSVHPVPYHLIDIASLPAEYSVFDYQRDFYRAFADTVSRGKLPVVAGGTGMYLDAVVRGYDLVQVPTNEALRARLAGRSMEELAAYLLNLKPELHNSTDLTERHRLLRAIEIEEFSQSGDAQILKASLPPRPNIEPLILGTTFPRDVLRKNITKRLRSRLKDGMIDEVRRIYESGVEWQRLERLGLEYRFIAEYLQGKIPSEDELFRTLNIAIGQFAKRQETWFRGMERKGVRIYWLSPGTVEQRFAQAMQIVSSCG